MSRVSSPFKNLSATYHCRRTERCDKYYLLGHNTVPYWGITPLTEASFFKWLWANSPIIVSFKETILSSSFAKQFSVSTLPAEHYLTRTRGYQTVAKNRHRTAGHTPTYLLVFNERKYVPFRVRWRLQILYRRHYFSALFPETSKRLCCNVASFANSPSSKAPSLSFLINTRNPVRR